MATEKKYEKAGQPKKVLTDEQVAELPTLAKVLAKEHLAGYFGMTKKTLLRIFKDHPEYEEMYNAGKAQAIARVAGKLLTKCDDGNVKAIEFFLATQAGWTKTEKIEQAVKVKSFDQMYDDDGEDEE